MAGSGTTVDVCEEEGRKVIGYDINPQHPEVIKDNSRKIPLEDNSVDMVFIDSPYGDNVSYSNEPADIGKISAEDTNYCQKARGAKGQLKQPLSRTSFKIISGLIIFVVFS